MTIYDCGTSRLPFRPSVNPSKRRLVSRLVSISQADEWLSLISALVTETSNFLLGASFTPMSK